MKAPDQCVKYVQVNDKDVRKTLVFIINFEQVSRIVLVLQFLIFNK